MEILRERESIGNPYKLPAKLSKEKQEEARKAGYDAGLKATSAKVTVPPVYSAYASEYTQYSALYTAHYKDRHNKGKADKIAGKPAMGMSKKYDLSLPYSIRQSSNTYIVIKYIFLVFRQPHLYCCITRIHRFKLSGFWIKSSIEMTVIPCSVLHRGLFPFTTMIFLKESGIFKSVD